jgi:hypothetical protein
VTPNWKKHPGLYTGDLDFDRFLNEWTLRSPIQCRQQYVRLLDSKGFIAANLIISYDKLVEGLRFVSDRIGVKDLVALKRKNESYGRFDISSLTPAQRDWIEVHFAQDREVLNGYCDRLLTSRPYVDPVNNCRCDFCTARSRAIPGALSSL